MLRTWPSSELSAAHYDKLYALALVKHERRRGSTPKCARAADPEHRPALGPKLPRRRLAAARPAVGAPPSARARSTQFPSVVRRDNRVCLCGCVAAACVRSDDVIGMLEEETEALIQRGYRGAPGDDADD